MTLNIFNSENLDTEHPHSGHTERFKRKLKKHNKQTKQKNMYVWSSVAASISLLLVFTLTFSDFFNLNNDSENEKEQTYTCINSELQELQVYYVSQESKRIEQIRDIGIDSSLFNQEIMQLDSMIQDLCSELNAAPNDERIIEMAVQHYTMKINTLDHILGQLKNIKHKKTRKNETINL